MSPQNSAQVARKRSKKGRQKWSNVRFHRSSSHRKKIKIYQKLLEIEKENVGEVARGDNHNHLPEKIYRAQSTNQYGVHSAHRPDLCFAICRFHLQQTNAQSLFLFPIVFGNSHLCPWRVKLCRRLVCWTFLRKINKSELNWTELNL